MQDLNASALLESLQLDPNSISLAGDHELRLGLAFDDHQCDVVRRARALSKLCQSRLDAIAYTSCGSVNIARNNFVETCRTKLFSSRAGCFGDTIRVNAEHVPGLQLSTPFAVLCVGLDAKRQTA